MANSYVLPDTELQSTVNFSEGTYYIGDAVVSTVDVQLDVECTEHFNVGYALCRVVLNNASVNATGAATPIQGVLKIVAGKYVLFYDTITVTDEAWSGESWFSTAGNWYYAELTVTFTITVSDGKGDITKRYLTTKHSIGVSRDTDIYVYEPVTGIKISPRKYESGEVVPNQYEISGEVTQPDATGVPRISTVDFYCYYYDNEHKDSIYNSIRASLPNPKYSAGAMIPNQLVRCTVNPDGSLTRNEGYSYALTMGRGVDGVFIYGYILPADKVLVYSSFDTMAIANNTGIGSQVVGKFVYDSEEDKYVMEKPGYDNWVFPDNTFKLTQQGDDIIISWDETDYSNPKWGIYLKNHPTAFHKVRNGQIIPKIQGQPWKTGTYKFTVQLVGDEYAYSTSTALMSTTTGPVYGKQYDLEIDFISNYTYVRHEKEWKPVDIYVCTDALTESPTWKPCIPLIYTNDKWMNVLTNAEYESEDKQNVLQ